MKVHFKKSFPIILFLLGVSYLSADAQLNSSSQVFTIVDSMPEFPGGQKAMNIFIIKELKYPDKAIKRKTQGKVYINFIIEVDGSISNSKVLKGIGHGCDEEALRIISLMPKWKAGFHKGKNVRVSFNLPITFKFNTDEEIYSKVDYLPTYNGGARELAYYISGRMKYPVGILQNKVVDSVSVVYVVEKDGSISKVGLLKPDSLPDAYRLEALRVVKDLPECEPGYTNGKAVRTKLLVDVVFDYNLVDTSYMHTISKSYLGNEYSYYEKTDYSNVDTLPEFQGGMGALYQFLGENIKYPKLSKLKGEHGRVYLNFIVEPDGSVTKCTVLWGPSELLNAEASRVVSIMPKWKPGIKDGKAVRVSYNLPIKFTLQPNNW
jgi:TonB family protein